MNLIVFHDRTLDFTLPLTLLYRVGNGRSLDGVAILPDNAPDSARPYLSLTHKPRRSFFQVL